MSATESTNEKFFEVWLEGYAATGQHSGAVLIGRVDAVDLRDAIMKLLRAGALEKEFFDEERLAYWGCRFFDNEDDARKSFG